MHQPAKSSGPRVAQIGPIIHISPFDEFGRRTFTMNTVRGPVDIVQGITELTPQWTKVEGITYMQDMRIATSSIPRDVLHKVLMKQIKNPKDVGEYSRIAHFYTQAELYEEARDELQSALRLFPDNTEVKAEWSRRSRNCGGSAPSGFCGS